MPKRGFHIPPWKQGSVKQQQYQIKCELNCSLIIKRDSQKPCPVNEQILSYIMLAPVHTLGKTNNSR